MTCTLEIEFICFFLFLNYSPSTLTITSNHHAVYLDDPVHPDPSTLLRAQEHLVDLEMIRRIGYTSFHPSRPSPIKTPLILLTAL